MKNLIIILSISSFSLFAGVDGIVTATKLNIRVKPGTNYAVVAQAKKGEKLQIIKHKDEWYEVTAPADTKVWVASSFLENGRIKKSVHLRSGPSVAFSSFRLAEKGEVVKVIDKSRKDWYQIEPPKGLTAWTSAKYVYLTPENAAKLTGKKPVAKTEKIPGTKKPPAKTKTADKKTPLPFTDGKGKQVSVEGFLVTLGKGSTYVTHAIASRINGEYFPLCYVHSKSHNLKLWEGRRVHVTGMQRWVKNWQRPVVEVDKITPTW
jgi:uncharacterized protein YgiM (DUF1202 family)